MAGAVVQAGWGVAAPKWLDQAGVGACGVWLARADAKLRRAAIVQLLPLLRLAEDEADEQNGWPLAQTRADVAVFLCGALRAQLCTSGASTLP